MQPHEVAWPRRRSEPRTVTTLPAGHEHLHSHQADVVLPRGTPTPITVRRPYVLPCSSLYFVMEDKVSHVADLAREDVVVHQVGGLLLGTAVRDGDPHA